MTGADTVIDCTNVMTTRGSTAVDFFSTVARTIAEAAVAAGVQRVVCVSIINAADPAVNANFGYYQGKAAQEQTYADNVDAGHLQIIRSAQWYELADQMLTRARLGPIAMVPRMVCRPLAAIDAAERSILLETNIFDRDDAGGRFVAALADAVERGVEVRVLIDAVGARYSIPSVVSELKRANVPVDVFNGNIVMGLRLPYANLRTHRKILIVDGSVAFTGGLNIRAGFCTEFAGEAAALDTHFRVTGPVVGDLFRLAYEDWRFSGGDELSGEAWHIAPPPDAPGSGMLARVVPAGPDKSLETNHRVLMGAVSVAKKHIRIMSPYFLPDRELISAILTAARRGVRIDIVVPYSNNLKLVDLAMSAQFDQMLKHGCRIWRAAGVFNHSKLTVVDDAWTYIGSSNIDPRSLRLNFEVDIEVVDTGFASLVGERIDTALAGAHEVTLEEIRARPFVQRLVEHITWLGSPYL